jgi:hypothetical protein
MGRLSVVLRPVRLLTPVAVLGATLGLVACGQAKDSAGDFQGEQRNVADVVEKLQTEGRNRNAGRICNDLLAPALVRRIEAQNQGARCADVLDPNLNDTDAFELQVEKVTITGPRATVDVTSEAGDDTRTDQLTLQKVGADWKIATLGAAS